MGDRIFVVRDFSGMIPDYSELLEINGMDVNEISRLQHELVPYEPNYAYGYLNEQKEFSFRTWVNFANYLFCENIRGPYTVKYSADGNTETVLIEPMERQTLTKLSQPIRNANTKTSGQAIEYRKYNDNIGVLDVNYFWGKNQLTFLFSETDFPFEKSLKKCMKQIAQDNISHLVIDLRSNPGGYAKNVYEMMSYLVHDMVYDDKAVYKISEESQVDDRGARILQSSMEMIHGKQNADIVQRTIDIYKSMPEGSLFRRDTLMPMTFHYENQPEYFYGGKVYVLTNSTTFSAATLFCNYFRKSGVGVIAGTSPGGYSIVTGGARIPIKFWLTNAAPMKIPHILNNPLEEDDYRYIIPDLIIENDLNDWVRGQDRSLDKLLNMIEAGNIYLPLVYFHLQ